MAEARLTHKRATACLRVRTVLHFQPFFMAGQGRSSDRRRRFALSCRDDCASWQGLLRAAPFPNAGNAWQRCELAYRLCCAIAWCPLDIYVGVGWTGWIKTNIFFGNLIPELGSFTMRQLFCRVVCKRFACFWRVPVYEWLNMVVNAGNSLLQVFFKAF